MLRHACSYALADKGHDTRAIQGWLGHRSITSTAVYTALAPNRSRIFGAIDPAGSRNMIGPEVGSTLRVKGSDFNRRVCCGPKLTR